jgi:hypothetical protein
MSNNVALALIFIRQNDNRIQLIVSCKWAFKDQQGATTYTVAFEISI